MVVSRSEIRLYISLLCVYTSHQTFVIVVLSAGQSSYSCRVAILYSYIQLITNENILDDLASQMRKYRNETVMIYLITLIASQVIVSSQTFYPSVNLHVF